MHPICFEIGSLSIRWYGVMAAVGFLLGSFLLQINRKHAKMSSDQVSSLLFITIILGVIGARLFYVIEFWEEYRNNLSEIIRIDHAGLVFYGGFFLAIVGILIFCKKQKLDVIRVMDTAAPSLAAAHAMGRIGCFLNGCCFGKPTDCAFGIAYPQHSIPAFVYGTAPLHPVQLYETAANLLLALLLMIIIRRGIRGTTMASYILFYGVIRFCDEFFRGDHQILTWGYFTPAQLIGLVLIPFGLLLLLYFWNKNRKHANSK